MRKRYLGFRLASAVDFGECLFIDFLILRSSLCWLVVINEIKQHLQENSHVHCPGSIVSRGQKHEIPCRGC